MHFIRSLREREDQIRHKKRWVTAYRYCCLYSVVYVCTVNMTVELVFLIAFSVASCFHKLIYIMLTRSKMNTFADVIFPFNNICFIWENISCNTYRYLYLYLCGTRG